MRHLSPRERIDAVDGTLAVRRRSHLEACPACRDEVASLRAVLDRAALADVEEPSPPVWDELSSRIRRAIASEPVPPRWPASPWQWLGPRVLGGVAAALVVAMLAWTWRGTSPVRREQPVIAGPARPAALDVSDLQTDRADSAAWAAVAEWVGPLDWETAGAAGLGPGLGDAERAVLELTPDEQLELRRLVAAALADLES